MQRHQSTYPCIEEFVADHIVGENGLYKTEAEFMAAVRKIVEGGDAKVKKGARTWLDSLKDFIRKLGERIGLLKGKEKAQAQETLAEMEHLRELFETAIKAATDRVAEARRTGNVQKNAAQMDGEGVQHSIASYNQIREKLAKAELDRLSDRLGEQFPLSSRFESYIKNTTEVVSSPTVVAGSVALGGRSYFKAAKDEFIKSYKKNETVNMAGTGIVATLEAGVANESVSKSMKLGDEQVILDIIPYARDLIAGGKLLGIERLQHTDNKRGGLFAYRVYNAFDYASTDLNTKKVTTTPYVFVATVVQQYDGDSIVHIVRGIEIATYDRGKLGKTEGSSPITGGKYKVAHLYNFVKGVPRDDGGLKYTAREANDYLFRYTKKEDGNLYSLKSPDAPVGQAISSAKTSIKQIPALFKHSGVEFGKTNIDIGGGKFDLATNYLAERGTKNMVFDPYNRGAQENKGTLSYLQSGKRADTATCANVLNVIAESAARTNVILEAAKAIKPDGAAYFMVYEGDGSGKGKQTSSGWQNNRKTADYVAEIEQWFTDVQRKGKLIIAKAPRANLPKAAWEITPGEAVMYSLKDSEGRTLTKKQQSFFKDSKVRDKDGNLLVMYHGTQGGGFTQFDPEFSDDRTSLFFTSSLDNAASYSGTYDLYDPNGKGGKSPTNYGVYLNLTKPLILHAQDANFDLIRYYTPEMKAMEERSNELTEYGYSLDKNDPKRADAFAESEQWFPDVFQITEIPFAFEQSLLGA